MPKPGLFSIAYVSRSSRSQESVSLADTLYAQMLCVLTGCHLIPAH